ncbi:MAG: rod shape-determining protein MreC, partial [bacterium]
LLLLLLIALSGWIYLHRHARPLRESGAAKDFSLSLWQPFQDAVGRTLAFPGNTLDAIQQLGHLRQEVDRLQQENQSLRLEISSDKLVQDELKRLKDVLHLKSSMPRQAQLARIIAHDPSTWNKSFVINKGSDDGIQVDSPVISEQGMVGRVIATTAKYSRVLLILDPGSGVGAIDVRSRVTGVAIGTGRNRLKLKYVNIGEDVQCGDAVVSSGLGGVFPKGYALVTVLSKTQSDDGLYTEIELVPAVDFSVLDYVFVLEPLNVYP